MLGWAWQLPGQRCGFAIQDQQDTLRQAHRQEKTGLRWILGELLDVFVEGLLGAQEGWKGLRGTMLNGDAT